VREATRASAATCLDSTTATSGGHASRDGARLQRHRTVRPAGRCVVPGRELVIAISNGSFPPAPSPEGQQLMVETEILPRLP
jgi:hypothetical protein